jgi:hypothetical protein
LPPPLFSHRRIKQLFEISGSDLNQAVGGSLLVAVAIEPFLCRGWMSSADEDHHDIDRAKQDPKGEGAATIEKRSVPRVDWEQPIAAVLETQKPWPFSPSFWTI